MFFSPLLEQPAKRKSLYYGWVIVIVGFLAHIASAFSISSTLSVFLKPLSADLGISRGVFSLIRSGEIIIGAAAAPVVGTLMDRHGGRWLMAAGGLISGAGFISLGCQRCKSCIGRGEVLLTHVSQGALKFVIKGVAQGRLQGR